MSEAENQDGRIPDTERRIGITTVLMDEYIMFSLLIAALLSSTLGILIARKVAVWIGLVDKPNQRKLHSGNIPLVGGIAIYLAICVLYFLFPQLPPHSTAYLFSVSLLLLVGILDDRFDLPVLPRVTAQAAAAILLMVDGAYLYSLGNLAFGEELLLGVIGYVITLFAMWASINAFNMSDGIDGLLGGLTAVSLAALAFCFSRGGQEVPAIWCLCLIGALVPYLLFNLGVFGRRFKIFMGDAGSTLLGFTLLWLLIMATQGEIAVIAPATALWLIAIPLMDMTAITIRRIRRGDSPFKPDREHLHHILMRSGLTGRQTLMVMVLFASLIALIGIGLDVMAVPELFSVTLFLLMFVSYFYVLAQLLRRSPQAAAMKGTPVSSPVGH